MYLLDTNIVSAIARDPRGPAGMALRKVDPELVATNTVVACEIRFGLAKNPASRTARRSSEFLTTMRILPLEPEVSFEYARARAWLVSNGLGMGANDLLIAAHALAIDATVVTDDNGFGAMPDLKVENWLRD